MNFDLTQEQQMIRKTIREFADEVVAPGAILRDKTKEFPKEIFKQLADMGMMGLPFPEEFGGAGADTVSFAIVTEELSRACASTGITYSAHISLGGAPLNLFGTEEQKQKYLVPVCTGESFGAFGLTEPNAGSDAGGTQTTAKEDGNNFVINGNKAFITNASYAKHLALTAITDVKDGKKEISAIIVPTDAENLLGKRGNGFRQFLVTLDGGRIGIGAMAVGIAQAAFDRALRYSKERKQFGKTLSEFQITQFKLADMAMKIELARTMVHKAAWLKDQGRAFSKEASMCKLYASEIAMEVADQAIQIHGGYGYMKEYEVER
jgi:alkylation response protein AidB-like acyl-CoA dehydrogenase